MGKVNVYWIVVGPEKDDVLSQTCLVGAPTLTLGNKGSEALMRVTFCCVWACACLLIAAVIGLRL